MEIPGQERLDRAGLLDMVAAITRGANNVQLVTQELYKLLKTLGMLDKKLFLLFGHYICHCG